MEPKVEVFQHILNKASNIRGERSSKKSTPILKTFELKSVVRNRNSSLLLGTIYRSARILDTQTWFLETDNMFSDLATFWNVQLVLLGDFNIDELKSTHMARQFLDILYTLNLTQLMDKPTRTASESETLIDHIIFSCLRRLNVAMYCLAQPSVTAIRVTRFAPRFKYIRNERQYNQKSYFEYSANLPLWMLRWNGCRDVQAGGFYACAVTSCRTKSGGWLSLACENIRFSSLFAAGDVSRGGTSTT